MNGKFEHLINKYRHRFFDERLKDLPIKYPEFPYLIKLSEEKKMKMNHLKDSLPFHKSHMTRAIQSLEDLHFIEKEVDQDDQRGYVVSITPEGEKIAQVLRQSAKDWEELTLSALSQEEIEIVSRIQEKIYVKIKAYFEEEMLDEKDI